MSKDNKCKHCGKEIFPRKGTCPTCGVTNEAQVDEKDYESEIVYTGVTYPHSKPVPPWRGRVDV